jgi:hypothetical protein
MLSMAIPATSSWLLFLGGRGGGLGGRLQNRGVVHVAIDSECGR